MKNKYKIMNSKPEISDEEIGSYMDFDHVLKKKRVLDRRGQTFRRIRNVAIGVVASVAIVFWFTRTGNKQTITTAPESVSQEPSPSLSVPPTDTIGIVVGPRAQTQPAKPDGGRSERKGEVPRVVPEEEKQPSQESTAENTPVYVQAQPSKGYAHLYQYFETELRYPQEAVKDSIEGVVTVVFTIDPEGSAAVVEIQNSLGAAFDDEVKRLVHSMPPWIPATYNGNAVKSKISLPVTFQLRKVYLKD